jgi:hypothetical protein
MTAVRGGSWVPPGYATHPGQGRGAGDGEAGNKARGRRRTGVAGLAAAATGTTPRAWLLSGATAPAGITAACTAIVSGSFGRGHRWLGRKRW